MQLQIFNSFAEADEADRRYYASLTPQQRLDLQLEIVARYREALGQTDESLERVYRVVDLEWGDPESVDPQGAEDPTTTPTATSPPTR